VHRLEGKTMSNEQKEPEPKDTKTLSMGTWMAIGVAIGAGLGVVIDNLPIGVAIGIALGTAIGATQDQRNKNK
jgi:hypothetical protein